MMFRQVLAGLAFLGALAATDASAQAPATVKICVQNGTTCLPVTSGNPLPTGGGGGGGLSVPFGGAIGANGTPVGLKDPATGFLQPFQGDTTNGLWVNLKAGALGAGTAIIGKVGIDQTTPGTTNGLALVGVNAATALAGAGAVGTGSLRIAVGQDTTTLAGSAPGIAGTPSTNVLSVQGEPSMTPVLDTPQATENHIGEVGGNALTITNDMTTTNATTTTGQSIGGLQTLANAVRVSGSLGASGTSGYIQTVLVTFTDAIGSGPLDVYFFNANPTSSTCTNDSAFVLANGDRDKVIGIVHVTDFTSSNTAVVAQANNQSMLYAVSSATSIFACVVARASFAIAGTSNASVVTKVVRN